MADMWNGDNKNTFLSYSYILDCGIENCYNATLPCDTIELKKKINKNLYLRDDVKCVMVFLPFECHEDSNQVSALSFDLHWLILQMYAPMSSGDFQLIRQTLLIFFQDMHIRVSK